MPNTPNSLPESISLSFQKLQSAASTLNSVSDDLAKFVARIDESLKKLNLGVSVWVSFHEWDDSHEGGSSYRSEDVGYAKINGRWAICLRKIAGDYTDPDREVGEEWLFNDAPRALRLEAVGKIAKLLEELSESATSMTTKVRGKLSEVEAIADAINPRAPLSTRSATSRNVEGVK
jgi:hypothetical protein